MPSSQIQVATFAHTFRNLLLPILRICFVSLCAVHVVVLPGLMLQAAQLAKTQIEEFILNCHQLSSFSPLLCTGSSWDPDAALSLGSLIEVGPLLPS